MKNIYVSFCTLAVCAASSLGSMELEVEEKDTDDKGIADSSTTKAISTSSANIQLSPDLIAKIQTTPKILINTIQEMLNKQAKSTVEVVAEIRAALFQLNMSFSDIKDADNGTLLHWGVLSGQKNIVEVILELAGNDKEAYIFASDKYRKTALHHAIKACEFLTPKKNTQHATKYNNIKEIVQLLLDAVGARAWELIKVKNKEGNTALELANGEIKDDLKVRRPNAQAHQGHSCTMF
jgi:ankyrin repeat protein